MDEPEAVLPQLAHVGLQTYLTAGPKEMWAWKIKKGATAPEAAGVIHTDFQRGFIKAEVVSFADLDHYGSTVRYWRHVLEAADAAGQRMCPPAVRISHVIEGMDGLRRNHRGIRWRRPWLSSRLAPESVAVVAVGDRLVAARHDATRVAVVGLVANHWPQAGDECNELRDGQ
jgi:hypothetical protein